MADPLTLTALGATALTEGIKFLYTQVTELLKRRREHKAKPDDSALAGTLAPLEPDGTALATLEPELRELRRKLGDYVDELEPVDPADAALLETMDAVRRMLEAIYRQRITFRGERRPESGPLVEGEVDVATVAGYAAAVRARHVSGSATVRGVGKADEVTGQFIGVDIDTIGDR